MAAATPSAGAPARGGAAPAGSPLWFDGGAPSRLDRMPVFGEAMAAVALAWTSAFAPLSAATATFAFAGLTDCKVSGLLRRRGADPVFAVLDAPGWATAVGLQFDRAFMAIVVEALFGGSGDGGDDGAEAAKGPLSAIETRIAEVVADGAAQALRAGFADVLPSAFMFHRVQPKPDPQFLGRPNASVIVATLGLSALGQAVEIDLLVPRAALDAFAERLAVLPEDEPAVSDPLWSEQLEGELSRAPMVLTATVDLPAMTLGSLARLAVGQVLALPSNAANDVRLLCEGQELFRCDLGQSSGLYTVRVGEPAARDPRARMGS